MSNEKLSNKPPSPSPSPSQDTSGSADVNNEAITPGYWGSFRFIGSFVAMILMGNSLFIGFAMPVSILSVINADIGPDPNYYMVHLVATLTCGVLLLLVGRVSDIFGRRHFLIAGQSCAVVGGIVCATANSITVVIGGTVLVGISAGVNTLYPLLSQELVPNKYRGWAQAAMTVSVFPTIGWAPAIARSLVQHTALGWRWIYWLNVMVAGLSLILLVICYFPPDFDQLPNNKTKLQELKQLDYVGFFLYVGGVVLVLLAFVWGEGTYAWTDAHVLALFLIGTAMLIGFGFYEVYAPLPEPLLPIKLFKIRSFVAVVIVGTVGQMVYYVLNVLWPTQISILYTTDNTKIGLMSNLAIAGTIIAGIFVGWLELVTLVVAGLIVPPNDIGVAQGFYASTRAVGGTISTSIYLCVFQNRLGSYLPRFITMAAEKTGYPTQNVPDVLDAITHSASLESLAGMNHTIQEAIETATKNAYSSSLRIVYLSSLSFGGLAIIAACFATSSVDKYLTDFVNKTIHAPGKKEAGKSSEDEASVGEA
ncbi:hypothetical protein FE257_011503 [Aspergillus nanangensis]|uniref:Major facilitator superfamily (MFS) profile domain-containing protein n=1 Tax=Aspergillus nanangensis TaxID=2582783 RepID=A0AAD4CHJ0_ASPNN|nr:hypothetical protein FE257_011503 [Aspergillus nanangensis]